MKFWHSAFEGWDFAPSGKVSDGITAEAQDSASTSKQIDLDDDLFMAYNQMPNWDPAQKIFSWMKTVCDKEVPPAVTKEIHDSFIPPLDSQQLFVPPKLPQAIVDKLASAPKNLLKVPKIVNDHLNRAQKELAVAYKPIIEVMSFFYTEEFANLKEIVPQLAPLLSSHKTLLSQSLALLVSAGIKISKARKDSLRPIFRTSAVLREAPTAAQVMGTEDLATLIERTTKEKKALNGVFRHAYSSRARLKLTRGNSRGLRNWRNARLSL